MSDTTVIDQPTKLAVAVKGAGLTVTDAASLIEAFQPVFDQAEELVRAASAIVVTDVSQRKEISEAKEMRLKLRTVRLQTEKARKELKEDSLRRGQAIDTVAGKIKSIIEPEEQRLLDQEQFAQRKEEERVAALKTEREAILHPLGIDVANINLGSMTVEAFQRLLEDSRLAKTAREEAAKKLEVERIAAEKARAEEDARIRAENERLKQEAEEREQAAAKERAAMRLERDKAEAAAKKERDAIEARAKAEREAAQKEREKIEAKARAEREAAEAAARKDRKAREAMERKIAADKKAEEDRLAAEVKARHEAELAPDKTKLIAYMRSLVALDPPSMASTSGKKAIAMLRTRLHGLETEFIKYVQEKLQ